MLYKRLALVQVLCHTKSPCLQCLARWALFHSNLFLHQYLCDSMPKWRDDVLLCIVLYTYVCVRARNKWNRILLPIANLTQRMKHDTLDYSQFDTLTYSQSDRLRYWCTHNQFDVLTCVHVYTAHKNTVIEVILHSVNSDQFPCTNRSMPWCTPTMTVCLLLLRDEGLGLQSQPVWTSRLKQTALAPMFSAPPCLTSKSLQILQFHPNLSHCLGDLSHSPALYHGQEL